MEVNIKRSCYLSIESGSSWDKAGVDKWPKVTGEGIVLSLCHLAMLHFVEYLHVIFAYYALIKIKMTLKIYSHLYKEICIK